MVQVLCSGVGIKRVSRLVMFCDQKSTGGELQVSMWRELG
jgi:asparagine synthetase A